MEESKELNNRISNVAIFHVDAIGIPLDYEGLKVGDEIITPFGWVMTVYMDNNDFYAECEHSIAVLKFDTTLNQWLCEGGFNKRALEKIQHLKKTTVF